MPHGKPYSPHLISQNFCAWEPLLRTVSEERRVLPLLACWLRTLLAWLGTVPTMPWPLCWGGHRVDQGEGHRQPCRGLVLRVLPGVYVGVEIAMNYSSQPGSLQVCRVKLSHPVRHTSVMQATRVREQVMWEERWESSLSSNWSPGFQLQFLPVFTSGLGKPELLCMMKRWGIWKLEEKC